LMGDLQRFKTERPMFYRGSLGALFVFDLTNFESFKQLPLWIEELRADLPPGIPILVAGNKCDLREQTTVSHEEIDALMRTYNLQYREISAKTGEGVEECFHALTLLTLANWNKREKKN
jgi:small GTP-binding protein